MREEAALDRRGLERAIGLPKGVVSAVEAGRIYAYPRFRKLVAGFLSARLGHPYAETHRRLFPETEVPPVHVIEDKPLPGEVHQALVTGAGLDPALASELYARWLTTVCESVRSTNRRPDNESPAADTPDSRKATTAGTGRHGCTA